MYRKTLAAIAALTLTGGVAAAAAQPGGNGKSGLTRETKYWRGAREETPGPFLCRKPAVTDALVTCDRWPDASDLRRFAEDAVRLSGAKTEEEKALAVWRWVRRLKVHTDGNSPAEPIAQERTSYVTDPIKVLNVYGAHFCGGLSRVLELVWRGAGHRADRIHCGSHSMAELYYRDFDGVVRSHLFDTNFGGFMYHSSRKRLMTVGEYDTDYSGGKVSWLHNYHWPWPTHRLELAFRKGEKLERIWGNWGKPYQSHMDPKRDNRRTPLSERGPYTERTYGNGLWTYSPAPKDPSWLEGLAEAPRGFAGGRFAPANPGRPASAVWHFRTPYIVSDVAADMKVVRKNKEDIIRLHVSVDGGNTWKQFTSPFGRYAFRLKLEMIAKESPDDCRVDALTFKTYAQQNIYALPQLQPGKNRITVRGRLEKGAALKVTYVWDDPLGKGRRNVTVVEKTPHEYEIIAAGKEWKDCVCKSITVEAVAATGKGNVTEVKEKPSQIHKLPAMKHVRYTRGRRGWWLRNDPAKAPAVPELVKRIEAGVAELEKVEAEKKNPEADKTKLAEREGAANSSIGGALKYLLEARAPAAFESVKKVVYLSRSSHTKRVAVTALFLCDRERSKAVLLDVLENPAKVAWTEVPIKKGPQNADQHWAFLAVNVGVLAEEAGWKEFTPGLVKVLESKHTRRHVSHAIMRVLASIGDERAAGTIRKALTRKGYAAAYAALAAAHIGDKNSVGAIRRLAADDFSRGREYGAIALGRLKDTGSAGVLRKMLSEGDENLRAAAAEGLGEMGDAGSVGALRAALAAEPFGWVREKMETAIKKLGG
ncbi:MAG: HEAT repeat domain-containing protein [Planctomycetota bacterium]|jgi:hypothetical protein